MINDDDMTLGSADELLDADEDELEDEESEDDDLAIPELPEEDDAL